MKNVVILLGGIAIGVVIGLCLPWTFLLGVCPQPLLEVCEHGFWDWTLRVLEVIGTLLAVVVALFKEDWVAYRFKPSLHLDKEHCDIQAKGANDHTDKYDAGLVLSNIGRAKANNVKVCIDRIEYRISSERVNIQTICAESYDLIIHGGSNQVCIPTDDELRVDWMSILQAPNPNEAQGEVPPVPPLNLMIGQKNIPSNYHNGVIDVFFKIKCDELKPQKYVLRIEWNGSWQNSKEAMQEVFSYKWLD